MTTYNEIFKSENNQKFYDIINNNILLLLNGNELKLYIELIHLNNIQQKMSMRTIMRFTRFSCSQAQQAIKTLRTIGIIGDKGYNLNLEKIEEIYNQLNSIIKLDDKLAYCDSLLNGTNEVINESIETIQQEEEEVQEEEPIYNKVEEEVQPTIDIETTTTDITIQEPKEEEVIINLNKEVMNEEVTTVQEPIYNKVEVQEHQQVPSKQELEKNAYVLINRMMNCESKKEWNEKQDKLFDYVAQNNTWAKEELNRITSALIESKTMWEQEQYHKAMNLIEAAQCGV